MMLFREAFVSFVGGWSRQIMQDGGRQRYHQSSSLVLTHLLTGLGSIVSGHKLRHRPRESPEARAPVRRHQVTLLIPNLLKNAICYDSESRIGVVLAEQCDPVDRERLEPGC